MAREGLFNDLDAALHWHPDYARIRLYVRDIDRAHVEASTAWIKQTAQGATLATQTHGLALAYSGICAATRTNGTVPKTACCSCVRTESVPIGSERASPYTLP